MQEFLINRCPRRLGIWVISFVLIMSPLAQVQAGTIVRVRTTMGDYSIELLDEITPVTVQNFLNYVNRGAYDGTYLHRVEDGFVVQGGAYRFVPFGDVVDVIQDPPIVNEFNLSNTRGTVAFAKLPGNPNSATNQWFVNLGDNSAELDLQNEGFTVFGNVLGDGMAVLDAIDDLVRVNLGAKAASTPIFTEGYTSGLDFVTMGVDVVSRFSEAPHFFDDASGILLTSVNVDNGSQLASVTLNLLASESGVVFQVDPASVVTLAQSSSSIATYSTADNRLRLPTLEVNLPGTTSSAIDVVFVLSDAENLIFTLESFTIL
jgi:peptidyl-prolyl cis-trans isomerase A (cyclophilin A)